MIQKYRITKSNGEVIRNVLPERIHELNLVSGEYTIMPEPSETKRLEKGKTFDEEAKEFKNSLTPAQLNDIETGVKTIGHNKQGFYLKPVAGRKPDSEIRISTYANNDAEIEKQKQRNREIRSLLHSVLVTAAGYGIHPDYTEKEILDGIKKLFNEK